MKVAVCRYAVGKPSGFDEFATRQRQLLATFTVIDPGDDPLVPGTIAWATSKVEPALPTSKR